ncbi:MAG: UDP-N-acetylmuramate dehydrogenase [Helicobacter sp.]|nr:UDP-N-acetylmuramate dehydrogenase [Helicobacter sp.]
MQKLIDFSKYTSIKIGTPCAVSIIDSTAAYDTLLQSDKTPQIIGAANNLLISPEAKNLAVLGKEFSYIKDCGDSLEIGAATASGRVFSYAKRHNLGGFEILSKLPGSIGGIIKMNAGLKEYEIKNILSGILVLNKSGKLAFKSVESLALGYRSSNINELIFAGIFKKISGFNENLVESFKALRANQPTEPSFGSTFKNPKGNFAGALIEKAGLKGVLFGKNKSLCFSKKHANFLINLGDSSFYEAVDLIELAKARVLELSGILLENEVQIIK